MDSKFWGSTSRLLAEHLWSPENPASTTQEDPRESQRIHGLMVGKHFAMALKLAASLGFFSRVNSKQDRMIFSSGQETKLSHEEDVVVVAQQTEKENV